MPRVWPRGGILQIGLDRRDFHLQRPNLFVDLVEFRLEGRVLRLLGVVRLAHILDRKTDLLDLAIGVEQRPEHGVFGGLDPVGNHRLRRRLLAVALVIPRGGGRHGRAERLDCPVEEGDRLRGKGGRVGTGPLREGKRDPAPFHEEVSLLREGGNRHLVGRRRGEERIDGLLGLVEQPGAGLDVRGGAALADEGRALEEVEPPAGIGRAFRRSRRLLDDPEHHVGHVPLLQLFQQGERGSFVRSLAAHDCRGQ